ncbi:carbon-nitrogen family hydrolase [Paenibacillus sp. YN15]|nr:carbon-nitrogen family hydrolase [Paenibacillus sp. YN15]
MDIAFGNVEENYRNGERLIRKAAAAPEKPGLLVLPELWDTAYDLERLEELGDWQGERVQAWAGALARELNVSIAAGSIAEKREDGIRNAGFVVDRTGSVVSRYAKLHLFGLMGEDRHLTAGESLELAKIEGLTAGMMICYDLRFPELARALTLEGAELLIAPAQWPKPRLHHWRILVIARAIENQVFVAACNRVGTGGGQEFFGHSMIVDPWGEVLAEGDEEESIIAASLDLGRIAEARERIPVLRDRRKDMYN